MNSVNAQYDEQHHGLLERVEQSLTLVETRLAVVISNLKPNVCSKLSKEAMRTMTNWYTSHTEHPYPNRTEVSSMAESFNVSPAQIRKWFSNHRQRLGHIQPMGQIIANRKRLRTVSQDDILLEGAKFSRHDC
jgi:hypothetical protein